MIKRALIIVSDKTGVVEFSKALESMGVEIISTGGTAKLLKESGIHFFLRDVSFFLHIFEDRRYYPAIQFNFYTISLW